MSGNRSSQMNKRQILNKAVARDSLNNGSTTDRRAKKTKNSRQKEHKKKVATPDNSLRSTNSDCGYLLDLSAGTVTTVRQDNKSNIAQSSTVSSEATRAQNTNEILEDLDDLDSLEFVEDENVRQFLLNYDTSQLLTDDDIEEYFADLEVNSIVRDLETADVDNRSIDQEKSDVIDLSLDMFEDKELQNNSEHHTDPEKHSKLFEDEERDLVVCSPESIPNDSYTIEFDEQLYVELQEQEKDNQEESDEIVDVENYFDNLMELPSREVHTLSQHSSLYDISIDEYDINTSELMEICEHTGVIGDDSVEVVHEKSNDTINEHDSASPIEIGSSTEELRITLDESDENSYDENSSSIQHETESISPIYEIDSDSPHGNKINCNLYKRHLDIIDRINYIIDGSNEVNPKYNAKMKQTITSRANVKSHGEGTSCTGLLYDNTNRMKSRDGTKLKVLNKFSKTVAELNKRCSILQTESDKRLEDDECVMCDERSYEEGPYEFLCNDRDLSLDDRFQVLKSSQNNDDTDDDDDF